METKRRQGHERRWDVRSNRREHQPSSNERSWEGVLSGNIYALAEKYTIATRTVTSARDSLLERYIAPAC